MSSCKKECSVRKLHIRFRRLFKASCFFTALEALIAAIIAVCQLIALFEPASRWLGNCADILAPCGFAGWKDVAMTVGLTGVLFAWLLQIIGDQTCGIKMDELFRAEFLGYTFLIAFFLQATILCIFVGSAKGAWRLLAPVSFCNMLCGIGGMWTMCAAFLFSTEKRRVIAFCVLEKQLEKTRNKYWLELWAQELNRCADRDEHEHISNYFQQIRIKAENILERKKKAEVCAEFCGEMIKLTWTQTGDTQWSRYMPYLLKQLHDSSAFYPLLSAYLLQAAKLGETGRDGDRYQAIMECLSRGTKDLKKVPGDILALYLAFITVYQFDSGISIDAKLLLRLLDIRWDWQLNNVPQNNQTSILEWMVWSYGIAFKNDHKSFFPKMQDPALQGDFDRFMKLYPWKHI